MPRKKVPDINELLPQTGRAIKENGETLNWADYELARRLSDLQQQSRDGTLFRSFFQGEIPANTTWYFVLDIPPGVTLFGVARFVSIEAGDLRASFFNGTGFGTVDATYPAFNFDNRDTAAAAQVQLKRVSNPVGLVQQSPSSLITAPSTGPQRRPSTQTVVGAQVIHDADNLPFFTLQNDTGAAEDVTIYLFWQELPA